MSKSRPTLLLLLTLHLWLLLSIRYTAWPEMFSFPYLLNNGFVLYRDFIHPYPPLLTIVLASFYSFFGYHLILLQFFTWILILCADILICKLVFEETKRKGLALIAVAMYVVLQPILDGNMMWYDNALTLPLLLSVYYYQKQQVVKLAIVLAFLVFIKQTALVYVAVVIASLLFKKQYKHIQKICIVLCSFFAVFVVYLLATATFNDFVNWNFLFPLQYWSKFPGYLDFELTRTEILVTTLLFVPVVFAAYSKKYYYASIAFAGLLAVYPRFSYFHLQPAIAICIVCAGVVIAQSKLRLAVIASVLTIAWFVWRPALNTEFNQSTRFFDNAFLNLTSQIADQVSAGSTIYLLNIPSHYYVFTNTVPPKPWFDNYGWYFEVHGQQSLVLTRWQKHLPESIIRSEPMTGEWYDLGVYEPQVLKQLLDSTYDRSTQITPGIWKWNRKI